MRTDEAYIRSMERRIRNQRAQLEWWNAMFQRGHLRVKPRWSVSDVMALLKRLGDPHKVRDDGSVSRPVPIRRRQSKER